MAGQRHWRCCLALLALWGASFVTSWRRSRSSVARHAEFNFKRLRQLKKVRPGPELAGRPYWPPHEKAPKPKPTAEELSRMAYVEKIEQSNDTSIARELLQEMKDEGIGLVPGVYHSVLSVCANATAWEDAQDVLKDMAEQQQGPDHRAYHLAMDAGRAQGAPANFSELLFDEMQMRGMLPTSETYTKVIHSYMLKDNEKLARRFYRQAARKGLLQIWINGGVTLSLTDFPTEVASLLLRLAVTDRAGELVGPKAGKRTIHILTRKPGPFRRGEGLRARAVLRVLKDLGIKAIEEPSDFGRIRIRGEELERFGCERRGLTMRKKARAR